MKGAKDTKIRRDGFTAKHMKGAKVGRDGFTAKHMKGAKPPVFGFTARARRTRRAHNGGMIVKELESRPRPGRRILILLSAVSVTLPLTFLNDQTPTAPR